MSEPEHPVPPFVRPKPVETPIEGISLVPLALWHVSSPINPEIGWTTETGGDW